MGGRRKSKLFNVLLCTLLAPGCIAQQALEGGGRVGADELAREDGPAHWDGICCGNNGDTDLSGALPDLDIFFGNSLPPSSNTSGYLLLLQPGTSFALTVNFSHTALYMIRARTKLYDEKCTGSGCDGSMIGMDITRKSDEELLLPSAVFNASLSDTNSKNDEWHTLSELTGSKLSGTEVLNFSVPKSSRSFLLDFISLYPHLPTPLPGTMHAETYRKWGAHGYDVADPGNQGTAGNFFDDVDVFRGNSVGLESPYAIRLNPTDSWIRYDVYISKQDFYTAYLRVKRNATVSECSDDDYMCRWRTAGLSLQTGNGTTIDFAPITYLADPARGQAWQIATAVPQKEVPEGFASVILHAQTGGYFVERIDFHRGFPWVPVPGTIQAEAFRKFGPWGYGFGATPSSATDGFQGSASNFSKWDVDVFTQSDGEYAVEMHLHEWLRFDVFGSNVSATTQLEVKIAAWVDEEKVDSESLPYFILGRSLSDGSVQTINIPILLRTSAADDNGFAFWCGSLNDTIPEGPQELLVFSGYGQYKLANFSILMLEREEPYPFPLCTWDSDSGSTDPPAPLPPPSSIPDQSEHKPQTFPLPGSLDMTGVNAITDVIEGRQIVDVASRLAEEGDQGYVLQLNSLEEAEFKVEVQHPMRTTFEIVAQSSSGEGFVTIILKERSTTFEMRWSGMSFTRMAKQEIEMNTRLESIKFINSLYGENAASIQLSSSTVTRNSLPQAPCRLDASNHMEAVGGSYAGNRNVTLPNNSPEDGEALKARLMQVGDAVTASVQLSSGVGKVRAKILQLDCCGQCHFEVTISQPFLTQYTVSLTHSGSGAREWVLREGSVESNFGKGKTDILVKAKGSPRCLIEGIELSDASGTTWPSSGEEWLGADSDSGPVRHAPPTVPSVVSALHYLWWEFRAHGGKEGLPVNVGEVSNAPGPADVFEVEQSSTLAVRLGKSEWIVYKVNADSSLEVGANISVPVQPHCSQCSVGIDVHSVKPSSDRDWLVQTRLVQDSTGRSGSKSSASGSWTTLFSEVSSGVIDEGEQHWRLMVTEGDALIGGVKVSELRSSERGDFDPPEGNRTDQKLGSDFQEGAPEPPAPDTVSGTNASASSSDGTSGNAAQRFIQGVRSGDDGAVALLAMLLAGLVFGAAAIAVHVLGRRAKRARTEQYNRRKRSGEGYADAPDDEAEDDDGGGSSRSSREL